MFRANVQENVDILTHVTRVTQYIKVFVNAPFSYTSSPEKLTPVRKESPDPRTM